MMDFIKATGLVSIYRNGLMQQQKNLVLTLGKEWVARRCVGIENAGVSHMAVGTGTTPAADSQTGLVTELIRVPLSEAASVNPSSSTMRFAASFVEGVGTGPLTEAGLFTAAVSGICVARTVFSVKNKEPDDIFTVVWEITIS